MAQTIKNESHRKESTNRIHRSTRRARFTDDIGAKVLGEQPNKVVHDDAASGINNFRTELMLKKSDAVIALFGDSYKQWNTAMDAGIAIGLGKPLILIRPDNLVHPLKELSNKAHVTVETIDQAIQVLEYYFK